MKDLSSWIAGLSPEQRTLFNLRLQNRKPQLLKLQPIARRPERGPCPLTYEQERLWFIQQLFPSGAGYNINTTYRFSGRLDLAALARSFAEVLRRHDILRTSFVTVDGQPVQVVSPEIRPKLPVVDLRGLAFERREAELMRWLGPRARQPFDLAAGEPVRLTLFRIADEDLALLATMHHIVTDWWSFSIFQRELMTLYGDFSRGRPASLPELPIQYADFAAWQRQWMRGEVLARQLEYWRRQLAGVPTSLELSTDRPRPAVASFRGYRQPVEVSPELADGLRELVRREDATLFTTLVAAYGVLLRLWSGQEDILMGTPIADRGRPETEVLIGYFLNLLILRADLTGGPTFQQVVDRVREMVQGAYANQDLPFGKLLDELKLERHLNRMPLFQVAFVYVKIPEAANASADSSLPSLSGIPLDPGTTRVDMTLVFEEMSQGARCFFEYSRDVFDAPTMGRMAAHFERLLAGVIAHPERPVADLSLLSEAERWAVLGEWNDTAAAGGSWVVGLFEEQAERSPDAVALVFQDQALSYAELNRASNRLAHYLRRLGVGQERLVGLGMDRSLDLVTACLAVLKAGGAYLPLDPSYPRDRLGRMLEDAGATVLLTRGAEAGLFDGLPAGAARPVRLDEEREAIGRCGGRNPGVEPGPEHLAYVLFTSGSTGRPKGVEIPHRALASFLQCARRTPGFAAGQRFLAVASFSFDASVPEVFLPLVTGGCAELLRREDVVDGARLAARFADSGFDMVQATPSAWLALVEMGWQRSGLAKALCSAEALPRSIAEAVAVRAGEAWNLYGPTETTVWATGYRVERGGTGMVPLGRPLGNTRVHMLNRDLRPSPVGVPGEVYIGGGNLARGYRGRPELTAERFVPDPFGGPGERLYRTGDLARHRPDGTLEFLGRADHQLKVRGYRIEPGEVEAVLVRHPAVREAVALAREEREGQRHLAAYLVLQPDAAAPAVGELRARLGRELPEYMVPSLFVVLPAMPRMPNGKVDRQALLRSAPERLAPETGREAPRTPTEEVLAALWSSLLDVADLGVHDNFFESGGHSLLGTRLMTRVREAFGVELPLRALFEAPTIAGLAARVDAAQGQPGAAELPPLLPRPRPEEVPLSFAQERLWFLDRLTPGSVAYNIRSPVRLRGPLDPVLLERCFEEVIRRHESLRTRFGERNGEPVQIINPPCRWSLPEVDLTALPAALRGPEAERRMNEEATWPFDLARGPLLRALTLRVDCGERLLLTTLHHIVSDGWSAGVLVRELTSLYRAFAAGLPSPLPALPLQYADFACWQRERLRGPVLEAHLAYWRRQLAGSPPSLDLPLDRPRPAVQTVRGSLVFLSLDRELTTGLRALNVAQGASLFMVLLAAFKLLLRRLSGQEDVVVGAPFAGRDRPDIEGLIGFFLNSLALRTDLSGRPGFRELVRRERATVLGAFSHQEVPFEKLLADLQPERDLSRTPLFQVFFNMLNFPRTASELPGGVVVEPVGRPDVEAKFDLTVYATEAGSEIHLEFVYNADLFDRARIEEMARQYRAVLAQVAADPDLPIDRVSLQTPEAAALLPDPAAPLGEEWHGAVHELFAARARRHPERPALIDAEGSWTYGELSEAVGRLAARLRDGGVGRGDRVAIYAHRSTPVVWAVLATLEAGAAFVLLDPAYPAARLTEMVRLAAPRAWLEIAAAGAVPPELEPLLPACRVSLPGGGPEGARALLAGLPAAGEPVGSGPDDVACIAFTSGSTGTPKGILGRHGPLSHFLPWQCETFGLGESDRYSMLSGLAHDPLQRDMFTPLSTGGTLCIPTLEEIATPGRLAAWMARQEITVAHLTPAMGQILTEPGPGGEIAEIPALRYALLVGDVLTRLDVDRIRRIAPRVTVVNLYGSTETQRAVGFHVVEEGGVHRARARQILPLGRGMRDVQLLIVSGPEIPALAGVGEVGEIWVRSPHLAKGYLEDETLTAERFRTNPFTGQAGDRVYRTGDLGRYLPDGQAVFAGRADQQVKIRGFRIELGEIETTLGRVPGIREAVVLAREDAPGARRLVAYFVPDPEDPADVEALRAALREKLPSYMVPATFVPLDRLPVTPNGKVDRRALPSPEGLEAGLETSCVEPESDLERTIAGVWREVLGLEKVGVRQSFFEVGGHSLLLVRLHARLQEALRRELSLIELFNYPSIRALTEHLGRKTAEAPAAGLEGVRDRAQKQIEAARRQKESVKARRRGG